MTNLEIESVFLESKLFKGIAKEYFQDIYRCLNGNIKNYKKEEVLLGFDEKTEKMGIILTGMVDFSIIQIDGSISLINRLKRSDSVAEVFACSNKSIGVFEYRCITDSRIIFLDIPKACTEKNHCTHSHKYRVMENMMQMIAENNIFLNKKIFILSQKKLRDKLLTYIKLSSNNPREWLTFNRQDLANFITADRSAVSRELMRMKRDGILEINENKLKILS